MCYNVFSATAFIFIIATSSITAGARRVGLRERRPNDTTTNNNGDGEIRGRARRTRLLKNDRDAKDEEAGSGANGGIIPRIVDGALAPKGEYGYFAAIQQVSLGIFDSHYCGGSLVHDDVILCAAHCIENADRAKVGAYSNKWDNGGAPYKLLDIVKKVGHPNYNPKNYNYDVALFKLEKPATGMPKVKLDTGISSDSLRSGNRLKVCGLGRLSEDGTMPDFLQVVELEYVPNGQCSWYYALDGGVTDSMMCAEDPAKFDSTNEDSCFGDSGGPLVRVGEGGEAVQVGIVSFGKGCGTNFPGVYARVSTVRDWIERTICEISDFPPDYCSNYDLTENQGCECCDEPGHDCTYIDDAWFPKLRCWEDFLLRSSKCDETCNRCD